MTHQNTANKSTPTHTRPPPLSPKQGGWLCCVRSGYMSDIKFCLTLVDGGAAVLCSVLASTASAHKCLACSPESIRHPARRSAVPPPESLCFITTANAIDVDIAGRHESPFVSGVRPPPRRAPYADHRYGPSGSRGGRQGAHRSQRTWTRRPFFSSPSPPAQPSTPPRPG